MLSKHGDRMVAVRQDQFLAASFHPELTDDHRVTAYFVEMVKEAKMKKVV
ncbi:glutamine amidotransferase subunit PdxT [Streptococcus pneumoniae]|nr:glutamine amidotransferase subunit PdxT [Streptococcus pneumoniae]